MQTYDRRINLHKLATELAKKAFYLGHLIGCPHGHNVRAAIIAGRELQEKHKPGRMIMGLNPEDREAVKHLKAEHFNNRLEF